MRPSRPLQALAATLLLGAAVLANAGDTPPDLVLRGTLDGHDHQTYRELPFNVPAGTTRITVAFEYSGREDKTTIDLGLIDPDGIRGWSGGNKSSFTVSATDATPSYRPGPITAGRWRVLLGIPNIRLESHAAYTARVWFEHGPQPYGNNPVIDPPLKTASGWYRGDLHMHDAHSDGSCSNAGGQRVPCPVFLTAQAAMARGLDFVAITDHNTVTQAQSIRELQPYFDRLLLMPGREITTFSGHANLWGTVAPLDFRVSGTRDWNAVLRDAAALQGVVSINHPVRPSGEVCMGCGWGPKSVADPALLQAVEVVNGMDADTPYSGIPFWESLLDAGYRLTAVGGSDNHDAGLGGQTPGGSSIGRPATVVHARALSVPAILDGLRAGEVFIDVQGSRDRTLSMTARAGGAEAAMGGRLAVGDGQDAAISVQVDHARGGHVVVVLDGRPWTPIGTDLQIDTDAQQIRFPWRSDGRRHWMRVDVRDAGGKLWLVGNPVYFNTAR